VISSITLAELSVGPRVVGDAVEQAARQDILSRAESEFEPLPFDFAAARAFGRVYAAVLAVGRNARHTGEALGLPACGLTRPARFPSRRRGRHLRDAVPRGEAEGAGEAQVGREVGQRAPGFQAQA
jgi:hypothetical protein